MEWISVKDSLPPYDVTVIVCHEGNVTIGRREYTNVQGEFWGIVGMHHCGDKPNTVSHYMVLDMALPEGVTPPTE